MSKNTCPLAAACAITVLASSVSRFTNRPEPSARKFFRTDRGKLARLNQIFPIGRKLVRIDERIEQINLVGDEACDLRAAIRPDVKETPVGRTHVPEDEVDVRERRALKSRIVQRRRSSQVRIRHQRVPIGHHGVIDLRCLATCSRREHGGRRLLERRARLRHRYLQPGRYLLRRHRAAQHDSSVGGQCGRVFHAVKQDRGARFIRRQRALHFVDRPRVVTAIVTFERVGVLMRVERMRLRIEQLAIHVARRSI